MHMYRISKEHDVKKICGVCMYFYNFYFEPWFRSFSCANKFFFCICSWSCVWTYTRVLEPPKLLLHAGVHALVAPLLYCYLVYFIFHFFFSHNHLFYYCVLMHLCCSCSTSALMPIFWSRALR